ncbi:MAG TPA: hypothetical protein PKE46_05985 [Micropruina sp.]|nr:hypothetical protein [Micropruina sp.]HMR21671.1 hypothetical protein [Micropruina sp.]
MMTTRARALDEDVVPQPQFAKTPEQTNADARRTIAVILIVVYVLLVIANVSVPLGLYMTSRPTGPFTMADVKDLATTITSVLAGLVGILGFVVGYYFKSADDKAAEAAKSRGRAPK